MDKLLVSFLRFSDWFSFRPNGEDNDDAEEHDDDNDAYECRELTLNKFLMSLLCYGHWFSSGLNNEDNGDVAEHDYDDNDAYECGNSH